MHLESFALQAVALGGFIRISPNEWKTVIFTSEFKRELYWNNSLLPCKTLTIALRLLAGWISFIWIDLETFARQVPPTPLAKTLGKLLQIFQDKNFVEKIDGYPKSIVFSSQYRIEHSKFIEIQWETTVLRVASLGRYHRVSPIWSSKLRLLERM